MKYEVDDEMQDEEDLLRRRKLGIVLLPWVFDVWERLRVPQSHVGPWEPARAPEEGPEDPPPGLHGEGLLEDGAEVEELKP